MIQTTPTWPQRAIAAGIAVLGTLGVALLVLNMNQRSLEESSATTGGEVSFEVKAPEKKKPPQKQQRQSKPKKTARAKPPPAPLIGAGLSGLSFGLDALAGGLGDDAASLLGDVSSVVMTAETVDELPTPISQTKPTVPARARQQGTEGLVVVSLLIGVDGRVQDVRVVESRPPGVFDEGVVSAVKQWTFNPAMYQGQPVPLRVDYPFRFKFD